ncbi:MAG: nucleotidyltransferase substrate binding protein [Bacteroidales bacterium]|nr:nucleotidyltransferase substrate binding protein [Bacteroidales bacterium]
MEQNVKLLPQGINDLSNNDDIRWQQRFANYQKALKKLIEGVELLEEESLTQDLEDIVNEGLIQRFEFTHELAWNVMKDYAAYQGANEIRGSRDAIRYALRQDLISDALWMETINARNLTSHDYNQDTANDIADKIKTDYIKLFLDFEEKMKSLICTD